MIQYIDAKSASFLFAYSRLDVLEGRSIQGHLLKTVVTITYV